MKKQKSSSINPPEISSSDEENAKPKIDKEDIRKYLQTSDEEDNQSQGKLTPQKHKKVKRLKKPSSVNPPVTETKKVNKPKKVIPQEPLKNNLVQGKDFQKLQKTAKKPGAKSLDHSKRKNYKYMVDFMNKKIHFGSTKTEDFITHKDQVLRDKYLNKAKKIKNKDGEFTYQNPDYPNYLDGSTFELKKKFNLKK